MQTRVSLRDALRRVTVVLAATCLGVGCQSAPKQTAGRTFRVMTYNTHHGEGLDGKVDLQRIADLLRREGADLVALQEVDKNVERTARRDFPVELAALTGLTCVFSNNYSFQGGEYGNAVLTRFPVKQATNTHYVKVNETEQRGLLQLMLDVHGREVLFLNTHLDHRADDAARWSNVGEIEEIVRRHAIPLPMNLSMHVVGTRSTRVPNFWLERWGRGGTRPYQVQGFKARILQRNLTPSLSPSDGQKVSRGRAQFHSLSPSDGERDRVRGRPAIILCGDFNDVPASRVCRRLSETFDDAWTLAGQGDGFTIPSDKPRKRIDYIWISRNHSLLPLKAWVPQSEASDHRPVVVELKCP